MPDKPGLTVRQLREALANFPDDLPVVASVPDGDDTSSIEYLVTEGPSHDQVDWGNGLVADDSCVVIGAYEYFMRIRPAD